MTRQPNGPARPILPVDTNEPPEEWDEEVLEDRTEPDPEMPDNRETDA